MLMKSSSTRLFIAILNFIFILPWLVQASHQHKRYVHVPLQMTWPEAHRYCREHHTELATFRNKNEYDAKQSPCSYNALCWIGLQRDKNDPNVWNWSDGEESGFTLWSHFYKQPDDFHGNENCVVMGRRFWYDTQCDLQYAFMCYKNDQILVKENKTWEEALEHCRTLDANPHSSYTYRSHRYDLTYMDFGGDNLNTTKVIWDAQTQEVWIGLRFLAGNLLWLDGTPLQKQLPACPAPSMYCGTMSKTGELLPLRNCFERRNFLCSLRN